MIKKEIKNNLNDKILCIRLESSRKKSSIKTIIN